MVSSSELEQDDDVVRDVCGICAVFSVCDGYHIWFPEVLAPFFPRVKYGQICVWRVCSTFFHPLTMRSHGESGWKYGRKLQRKMWRMQCRMSDDFRLTKRRVKTNW